MDLLNLSNIESNKNIIPNVIQNTSIIKDTNTSDYPLFISLTKSIRPKLILDLNGILVYSSHLIDLKELTKYISMKNFMLIYRDFDMNMYIIFYRPYIREFLLELNNYYDIYIYSTLNKIQTDIFISTLNNLIGINVFKGVYIKFTKNKTLEDMNLKKEECVIIDINDKMWNDYLENLILINVFRGPHDIGYDKNTDLQFLKKCLLRIYKSFMDNNSNDIRQYIHSSVESS
jgi:hypothetical protein